MRTTAYGVGRIPSTINRAAVLAWERKMPVSRDRDNLLPPPTLSVGHTLALSSSIRQIIFVYSVGKMRSPVRILNGPLGTRQDGVRFV
jgi:hypothetical protein